MLGLGEVLDDDVLRANLVEVVVVGEVRVRVDAPVIPYRESGLITIEFSSSSDEKETTFSCRQYTCFQKACKIHFKSVLLKRNVL